MKITDIQKTKKGRYSIFADGEFLFSIHKDTYLTTDISANKEMSVEELEELRTNDEFYSCKQTALNILSAAAKSTGVLRDKLLQFYSEDAVENTIERMTELNLLDDYDYARRLTLDYINLRGYSKQRIKTELYKKKIDKDIIEDVLTECEEFDETAPIIALIQKKYSNKIQTREDLHKTILALQRRGFLYEDIKTALNIIEEM